MIKVYVWLPDDTHIGHCALAIRGRYISFWPADTATKKDLKIKRSHPGMFVQSLNADIENEGGRNPETVELYNLNEQEIMAYIATLDDLVPRYQIARNNCSHVIAKALMAGANKKPSFVPHAGHYGNLGRVLGIGIWTPDQVLKFARELKFL